MDESEFWTASVTNKSLGSTEYRRDIGLAPGGQCSVAMPALLLFAVEVSRTSLSRQISHIPGLGGSIVAMGGRSKGRNNCPMIGVG